VYAVLIEVDVTGVEEEAGLRALREQIVPAVKTMPGFVSGTWLPGNDDGKGLSFTVWDTEAHARAMEDRFGIGSNPAMSAMVSRCEVREVAATASADEAMGS
jgi:hypothetical protein